MGLIGIWKAYNELHDLGWVTESPPRLTVAQTEGAAPVVRAIHQGGSEHEPWDAPDFIAKGVEIPDPGASPWMLDAVNETDSAGVAVSDEDAIEAAIEMAQKDGIEMCVTAAVELAGAIKRAENGAYDSDEQIVIINTGADVKTSARLGHAAQSQLRE